MYPDRVFVARLALALACLVGCGDSVAPAWPDGAEISAGASTDSLELGWPAATDDDAVVGYSVYIDDAEVAQVGADVHRHTVGELREGQRVQVRVVARDASGNLSALTGAAETLDETPPVFPEDATLQLESFDDGVRLEWPAAEDATEVTYVIFRGEEEERTQLETNAELGRGDGSTHFRVIARDASGHESEPLVAEWIAPPPRIEGVTAETGAAGELALRATTLAHAPDAVRTRASSDDIEVAARGPSVVGSGNAVTRISGTRHAGPVRRALWDVLRPRYDECYNAELREHSTLSGLLRIRVRVTGAGRLENVEIRDNHVTAELAECVLRHVRRANFARGGGEGVFELRLQFQRE